MKSQYVQRVFAEGRCCFVKASPERARELQKRINAGQYLRAIARRLSGSRPMRGAA